MFNKKQKDDLINRKKTIHGNFRSEKQHNSGKMTAWERIQALLDTNTFVETNMFIEHRCSYFGMEAKKQEGDGVITGYGQINGRTVCVFAQDATIFGGSISEMNAKKITGIQEKALSMQVPLIGLFDSSGARVQEGIQGLSGVGSIFYNNVQASGKIPQISAIMGTCAGGASYSPALTDFIIMVDKTSNMFITGPKVVKAAIGQDVTMDELGGVEVHATISGLVDYVATDDAHCLACIRQLVDFLPSNHLSLPSVHTNFCYEQKKQDALNNIIPVSNNQSCDVHQIIQCLIDSDSIMEFKDSYATNMVTAFARMGGYPIGIVANQSAQKAGCIDIDAADKAARFIRTCDAYNIPLLTLVDVSGFYPGKEQEQKGILRHGAKMLFAYAESHVPKITVILRKAYGGAYLAMCSKELGADAVYAWSNAEMAVMSAQAAADVLYKNASKEEKEHYIAEYKKLFLTPMEAAHMGYIDEVIEPSETRSKIINILNNVWSTLSCDNFTSHKNMPV